MSEAPRRARPRSLVIWLRWLGAVLLATLVARLLLSFVMPPDMPAAYGWFGALLLGLGAVFVLLPSPTEHWWDTERRD